MASYCSSCGALGSGGDGGGGSGSGSTVSSAQASGSTTTRAAVRTAQLILAATPTARLPAPPMMGIMPGSTLVETVGRADAAGSSQPRHWSTANGQTFLSASGVAAGSTPSVHSFIGGAAVRVQGLYPPVPGQPRIANPSLRPTIPVLVSDDLVSGTENNGRMSPVRRFFCLLVTFDFLFSSLMWVITVIVTGRDPIADALGQQVLQYSIRSSMFDCVVAAFSRFLICLLFYALLDLHHWWPIALTTTGTSAFIVAKVFEYQWAQAGNNTFDICLCLFSFILAWGELWFLDFRVLPLESKAKEIIECVTDDEHRPLLINQHMARNYMSSSIVDYPHYSSHAALLRSGMDFHSAVGAGSVADFYSTFEGSLAGLSEGDDDADDEDADDEIEPATGVLVPRRFTRKYPLSEKELEYRGMAETSLQIAWATLNGADWNLVRELDNGDTIHSKINRKGKTIFKLTGIVDLPAKFLLEEIFYGLESAPRWNPTLAESRSIQLIDAHTDITYQVAAEAAGGMVSPRDFVNLRHWDVIVGCGGGDGGGEVLITSCVSVEHPAMPEQPKRVRGENGPGCWAMRAMPNQPTDRCLFQWLLDTDLKGWIPQSLIDAALCGAQLDYVTHLRRRAESLRRDGSLRAFFARDQATAAAKDSNVIIN